MSAWVEMWNTYDLDRVDRLFLVDDRVTYFSSEREGLIRGIEELRQHHRGFGFTSGGEQRDSELWLEDTTIQVFDAAAFVGATWFFRQPEGTVQRGPMSALLVRVRDGYRIAHMNFGNYEGER